MNPRDLMLIRAGWWVGILQYNNIIYPPLEFGSIEETSEFIVNAVADYIITKSKWPFDLYIEELLKEEYGTINDSEAKSCSTCRYDNDIYSKICNTCDWREKWKPKESDNE